MKRFLLLCVLFVACLAPCAAEGAPADWSVTIAVAPTGGLEKKIKDTLDDYVNDGATINNGDTISIKFNADVEATITTAAISVPYSYLPPGGTDPDDRVLLNSITIKGPGTLKTDGDFRHFLIGDETNGKGEVTFEDVILDGNNNTGGGIKVTNGSTATFKKTVTFQKNGANDTADIGNGGAIEVDQSSKLAFDNTATPTLKFISNKTNGAGEGGAIYSDGDLDLSKAKVEFTGNETAKNGGAICSTGKVTVADGKFEPTDDADKKPNKAATSGGAIYAKSVSLTGETTFTKNEATTDGGAICTTEEVTLAATAKATFTGNTTENGDGGAISSTGNVTINAAAEFKGNTATGGDGGAIHSTGAVNMTAETEFKGNTAESSNGGAIHSGGKVTVTGGTFGGTGDDDPNTAVNGGAIYAAEVELKGTMATTFTGNKATTGTGGSGGAIHAAGAVTLGTAPHTFTGNEATTSGGAIFTTVATGMLTVNGQTFKDNKATGGNGGAIHTAISVEVKDGTFTGNTAGNKETPTNGDGGAIYATAALVAVTKGTFNGNTATGGNGGAICTTGNVTVDSGTFGESEGTKNTAAEGGAIHAKEVTINGGVFKNNAATGTDGGAIYATKVTLTKKTSTSEFTGNTAENNGGAIYTGDSITIDGGTFNTNTAKADGGAVYAGGCVTSISGGTFKTNTAKEGNGGAVYSTKAEETTTITNGTFEDNKALISGGALYAGGDVNVQDGLFQGNGTTDNAQDPPAARKKSVGGGAIYAVGDVNVEGGNFYDNISENIKSESNSGGGAIYAGGDVLITDGVFTGNNSNALADGIGNGGGAIWSAGSVTVDGSSSFASTSDKTANKAQANGGAIYAVKKITVNSSADNPIIFNNQIASRGGALYAEGVREGTVVKEGGIIEAKHTIFTYNRADLKTENIPHDGGATYSAAKSIFTNCFFYNNQATRDGGASVANPIEAVSCTYRLNTADGGGAVEITSGVDNKFLQCVFDENAARNKSGGAIYAGGNKVSLEVEDSYFLANRSQAADGGAIATGANPQSLTLQRCTFENNEALGKGNGGAAYIETKTFKIANCTFYGNTAGVNGGALQLPEVPGARNSALVFNTIVGNNAGSGGSGGGINSGATFIIGANIVVDNNATRGKDIFAFGGVMNSRAYNFIVDFGDSTNDHQNWNRSSFVETTGYEDERNGEECSSNYSFALFDPELPGDYRTAATPDIGARLTAPEGLETTYTLRTLALKDSDPPSYSNPAQEFIPRATAKDILSNVNSTSQTDERGALRTDPNVSETNPKWDSGAHDTCVRNEGGGDDPQDDSGTIRYIQISGLPNTLRTVGQTTSLFALGYNIHNEIVNRDVPVKWTTDNTGVARFHDERSGNIFVYSLGTTTITATPIGLKNVSPATAKLRVTEGESYTNVHETIWQALGIYNDELSVSGVGLTIATSENPALVKASAFQSSFKKIWSLQASQVTALSSASDVHFTSRTAVGALKPGVNVAVTGREKGELLPLEYMWTFSYDQLSKLLDRNVTSLPTAEELGKAVQIDFEAFSGAKIPVIASPNAGSKAAYLSSASGVSAVDAALTKALEIKESHDGATIHLKTYLANVQGTDGAQLVERLLVVPDGVADNAISGTMWLNKKVESSNSNNNNNNNNDSNKGNGGGGGGGGGCDATGLGLAVLLLALPLLARRRR